MPKMPGTFAGLPWQNVMVIGAVLFVGETAMERLTEHEWGRAMARGLVWAVMVFVARLGAARALCGWRGGRYFGLVLMAVVAGATALAQPLDAEFCTRLGCAMRLRFCSTFLLLAVTAPWFIRKENFAHLASGEKV